MPEVKKENLQQLQTLKSLLEEGNELINCEGVLFLSLKDLYIKIEQVLGPDIKLKQEALKTYELFCKLGLSKKKYACQFVALFEQGLISSKSKEIERIVLALKAVLKTRDMQVDDFLKDISFLSIFAVDLNLCNSEIKRCIRDTYLEIVKNHMNSILQRKISLNSKRLAILNCKKQIQNISSEFSPYSLTIEVNDNDFFGRKCDESKRSYCQKSR